MDNTESKSNWQDEEVQERSLILSEKEIENEQEEVKFINNTKISPSKHKKVRK